MTKATEISHRVVKLPQRLRQAIRNARDEQGITNEEFVAVASPPLSI